MRRSHAKATNRDIQKAAQTGQGPGHSGSTSALRPWVPNQPKGVTGVYNVAEDWTPIYDKTDAPGFYVALAPDNQFKNVPRAGKSMAAIVVGVENGHDHDSDPVWYLGAHTGLTINLGAFSRKRPKNQARPSPTSVVSTPRARAIPLDAHRPPAAPGRAKVARSSTMRCGRRLPYPPMPRRGSSHLPRT